MIIIPAQRHEGRTKCKVSKQMAHLVARIFKAFTNLKEETKFGLPSSYTLSFMYHASSSQRTFRYAKWPHSYKVMLHEAISNDNF